MTSKLIKNVNCIDVTSGQFREGLDILIQDGVIADMGSPLSVSDGNVRTVDCTGRFAIPGLFECHGHLAFLTTMESKIYNERLAGFVRRGITQVRDVGGPVRVLQQMKRDISEGDRCGPEIFYAGPMLEKSPLTWEKDNEILPGFTVPVNNREDAERIISELVECGASHVKTFNTFDPDIYRHLFYLAETSGLPVVHDPGMPLFNSVPMDLAMDIGVRCIEHGKAPWPVVLKDELKWEHDRLLRKNLAFDDLKPFMKKVYQQGLDSICEKRLVGLVNEMAEKKVYFCPTLHVFSSTLDDDTGELSEEERKKMETGMQIMRTVTQFFIGAMVGRKIRFLVGHDGATPEFTFSEMEMLKEAGVPEIEIIRGATQYPSEWLGVTHHYGDLSTGKKANILVVNENPLDEIGNLRTTFLVLQNGKIMTGSGDTE